MTGPPSAAARAPDAPAPTLAELAAKARWVWAETLRFHGRCPETRVASSLSLVEVFTVLLYGGVLHLNPADPKDPQRDRLIVSKGHGSTALYPILADLGFYGREQLENPGGEGSFLGSIPDPIIPGYETANGSLGHGPGVACGIAYALRLQGRPQQVLAILGDGELYEGSVWEAVLFAGHHRLDNLSFLVDNNRKCMMDLSANVIGLEPIDGKFRSFGWEARRVDGHDLAALLEVLPSMVRARAGRPKVLVADTVKGKGVPAFEADPMCHVRTLDPAAIAALLGSEHA